MRKQTLLLLCFLLTGLVSVHARNYTVKDVPMVHLQDRTRYVSNPDGILSTQAVSTIDSLLHALEQKTGIQTLVAVVTGIEGGDCFDFAHRLGQEMGVGQKERNNGLVVLLSTDERCIQFATGYGLEGTLPDAICKRIQNRYMLPHFANDNWDAGMVEGMRAVNGYLDGSMENIEEEEEEDLGLILLIVGLIFGGMCVVFFLVWRASGCPKCKKHQLQRMTSRIVSRRHGIKTEEVTYLCCHCGHTFTRREQSEDENDRGPRHRNGGTIFMGGGGFGSGGSRGFGGGSFGGGSFGGGGAGSRF